MVAAATISAKSPPQKGGKSGSDPDFQVLIRALRAICSTRGW
jgi:hypothetical protein